MKPILLLLLICSCSSWKQKDFEKDLDVPAKETEAQVEIKDVKLVEKFEVTEVAAPAEKEKVKEEKKAAPKKQQAVKASSAKPAPVQVKKEEVKEVKHVVKSLPADYPKELVDLDKKSKKIWDLYKTNHHVDQKIYLNINYLGMTVGKIMVTNRGRKMMNDKEVWHFHARFKSAPFYSNVYELDDTVDTFVQTDKFLSVKYSLVQRESKQEVDDLQLHDRDQLKSFWFYKRKKEDGKVKEKKGEKYIPHYITDPFSLVFFYQGLPLNNKDVYEIPLINKDKILIMKSQVEGRETIQTELGSKKAIRIHATTQYTGETLKSGDLYFWISDDESRQLLKAQAKIKIGSVTADIVKK